MSLPSPTSYPWVNFLSTPRPNINSTPVSIFGDNYLGSAHACIIVSILVCNTTNRDIFVYVRTLTERLIDSVLTAQETFKFYKKLLPALKTVELLDGAGFHMEQGDLLYAYSDQFNNSFDSTVSYRELREQ